MTNKYEGQIRFNFHDSLSLLSGVPLISGDSIANYANAKYATNTQTQANANECNTGTNCAITSPQTQGDGSANSPTNLQISKFNEEEQVELPTGGSVLLTVENCTPISTAEGPKIRCILVPQFQHLTLNCFTVSIGGTFRCTFETIRQPPQTVMNARCAPLPSPIPGQQTIGCDLIP